MIRILMTFLLMASVPGFAQQDLALTPTGYGSVTFDKPSKTDEKIIEKAKAWAAYYNRDIEYPHDVYDVTSSSFKIDGHRPNAFYYRNRGEAFYHRIKYTITVQINESTYTIGFSVKEIYTSDVLTELTVADFFAPDGRLKEDYLDAKPSLDKTVNGTIRSLTNYLATY